MLVSLKMLESLLEVMLTLIEAMEYITLWILHFNFWHLLYNFRIRGLNCTLCCCCVHGCTTFRNNHFLVKWTHLVYLNILFLFVFWIFFSGWPPSWIRHTGGGGKCRCTSTVTCALALQPLPRQVLSVRSYCRGADTQRRSLHNTHSEFNSTLYIYHNTRRQVSRASFLIASFIASKKCVISWN